MRPRVFAAEDLHANRKTESAAQAASMRPRVFAAEDAPTLPAPV